MRETSARVTPGGGVTNLGSLDSLAKVKFDSMHPVIAQQETRSATISANLSVREGSFSVVTISSLQELTFISKQYSAHKRAGKVAGCDTFKTATTSANKHLEVEFVGGNRPYHSQPSKSGLASDQQDSGRHHTLFRSSWVLFTSRQLGMVWRFIVRYLTRKDRCA